MTWPKAHPQLVVGPALHTCVSPESWVASAAQTSFSFLRPATGSVCSPRRRNNPATCSFSPSFFHSDEVMNTSHISGTAPALGLEAVPAPTSVLPKRGADKLQPVCGQ